MANGNPAHLPGWLGPIVTITTQVGVPTVLAGILLWFVLFKMGGTLDMIMHEEEDRTRVVAAMQETFIAALDRQRHMFDESMRRNTQINQLMADRFIAAMKQPSHKE